MAFFKAMYSAVTDSGVENPPYEVVANHGTYEERNYPATSWVSRTNQKMSQRAATSESFWQLFNYIQGKNEKSMKIDMTAPVSIKVEPGAGPNCESTFTTSFYIGKEHEAAPPAPTNPELSIHTWQPMTIYSRQFGGFANDEKWVAEAAALGEAMKEDHKFEDGYYYLCGYNSPFKLFNRRNEVWFIKKTSEE